MVGLGETLKNYTPICSSLTYFREGGFFLSKSYFSSAILYPVSMSYPIICSSIHACVRPSAHASVNSFVHSFICLFVCLFVHRFVCSFICLFVRYACCYFYSFAQSLPSSFAFGLLLSLVAFFFTKIVSLYGKWDIFMCQGG
jgi:hypothetical protein